MTRAGSVAARLVTRGLRTTGIVVTSLALLAVPAVPSAQEWYLLRPPLDQRALASPAAPVSRWIRVGAFDSAEECAARRDRRLKDARESDEAARRSATGPRPLVETEIGSLSTEEHEALSRCLSAADPRLAPKASN